MNKSYRCASCGILYDEADIVASKCQECHKSFLEKREKLASEGYFNNMKRLGTWKINSVRKS